VGDARLTLAALRHEIHLPENELKIIEHRMHQPTPRVDLGIQLREIATAALDISDGLLGDLKHLLHQSRVDAEIFLDQLPKSAILQKQSKEIQNQFAASGGDDYELCFTAPKSKRDEISNISKALQLPLTRIGRITSMTNAETQMRLIGEGNTLLSNTETTALLQSFDHFAK
jgi:thiamine-monophosphate kinase